MTIEEIQKISLDKYGKELTDEEASDYFKKLGKLSDDELENVSGGGICDGGSDTYCPMCKAPRSEAEVVLKIKGSTKKLRCNNCGHIGWFIEWR